MLKAATSGDAEAQYELAIMYANADGVLRDDARATKWLHLAAEQGHLGAQNELAQATGLASLSLETSPRQLIGFAKQQNKVMPQLNLT